MQDNMLQDNMLSEAEIEPADEALIANALAGDRAAFAMLLNRHYMLIYKIAFKWCAHQSDAEDITQEVCLKLATTIKSFDGRSKFTSWLYRVTLNMVRDMQRSTKRRNARHAALLDVSEANMPLSQEEVLLTNELWQAVRQLPQKQCDAVLLVYAQELNHLEAAKIMDVKESTISWYIMEAKKSLKGLL
jgi:RNA polymerase sigma-70 factor (ECF subfamily)